jgi:integrase
VQKQKHDERAARMFVRLFGPLRKASTLNVRDWGEFIRLRRSGALTTEHGKGRPVGNRQIEYDLKFLLSVLNWATKAQANGERVLDSNPLRGLKLPKEKNPSRPTIDDATYQQLRAIAPSIDWRFEVALVLAHETGHRIGAIRHLRWADVDFDGRLVTWRAKHDKSGVEHITPLTSAAVTVLTCARRRSAAIGDGWVIPAPTRPERLCSRHVLYKWLKKGLRAIGRGAAPRIGYHCFRRKFATDLKAIPLRDLMALGSWKDPKTVVTCYQHADIDALRDALGERAQSTHLSTHLGHESTVAR